MLMMAASSHRVSRMMRTAMMRDGATGTAALDATKAERPVAIATTKPSALATMVASSQIGRPSDADAPTPMTSLAESRARETRLDGGATTSDTNRALRRPRHRGRLSAGLYAQGPRRCASMRDRQ